jgi:hypothetical protein
MITGNELIEAAQAVIDRWDSPKWRDEAPTAEFIGRLRKAVDEEKARTEWVKFTDGLPVVPEGKEHVRIWLWRDDESVNPYKGVFRKNLTAKNFIATHWQYRQDDTPAPPEA